MLYLALLVSCRCRYVGAYLNDGLHAKVLLALAQELRAALPGILGPHPLRHLWAYKYDERYTGMCVCVLYTKYTCP